jgi:hypothetical protein
MRQPAVGTPSAGAWKIDPRYDRISGATEATARLTQQIVDPRTLVSHAAILQLACFKGGPVVRFAFDFNIGSANSTTLSYRFDDKPGHPNVKAKLNGRGIKVLLIDDRAAVAQFVDELATSSILYLRVVSLTAGRTNLNFRVSGAPAAIEASYATCPIRR